MPIIKKTGGKFLKEFLKNRVNIEAFNSNKLYFSINETNHTRP